MIGKVFRSACRLIINYNNCQCDSLPVSHMSAGSAFNIRRPISIDLNIEVYVIRITVKIADGAAIIPLLLRLVRSSISAFDRFAVAEPGVGQAFRGAFRNDMQCYLITGIDIEFFLFSPRSGQFFRIFRVFSAVLHRLFLGRIFRRFLRRFGRFFSRLLRRFGRFFNRLLGSFGRFLRRLFRRFGHFLRRLLHGRRFCRRFRRFFRSFVRFFRRFFRRFSRFFRRFLCRSFGHFFSRLFRRLSRRFSRSLSGRLSCRFRRLLRRFRRGLGRHFDRRDGQRPIYILNAVMTGDIFTGLGVHDHSISRHIFAAARFRL